MDDQDELAQMLLEEDIEVDKLVASVFDSSSDKEEKQWGGSRPGRAPNKNRDFLAFYHKLIGDYFNGIDSVCDETDFERRFRMPRLMHEELEQLILGEEPFVQKKDVTGKLGIHPKVKLVACLRYIVHGVSCDREDENLGIAASTLHPIAQSFCRVICRVMIEKLGTRFLNRTPTQAKRQAITAVMACKGFPGLIASWDCKHFTWQNCPLR